MLTEENFRIELNSLKTTYRTKDSWVNWDNEQNMNRLIDAAYKLYVAAATNKLQFVLLGSTEIRSMSSLIQNFGLLSAAGVQSEKDAAMVNQLQGKRDQIAAGTPGGIQNATKVVGPGSILSDKMWTTILNDALMLGGIQGNQEFHLALSGAEQAAWTSGGFGSDVARKSLVFDASVPTNRDVQRSSWIAFLRHQPQMLWLNGRPRVFVRELLALKFFGYKPDFSRLQLSFGPHAGRPIGEPSFCVYMQSLETVQFFDNNKNMIMSAVSEFLFDDKAALT